MSCLVCELVIVEGGWFWKDMLVGSLSLCLLELNLTIVTGLMQPNANRVKTQTQAALFLGAWLAFLVDVHHQLWLWGR